MKPRVERNERMMTVSDILAAVYEAGGTVQLDGDDLLLRFPVAPPGDLIAAVRQRKTEIIGFLRGQPTNAPTSAATSPWKPEPKKADTVCPRGSTEWRETGVAQPTWWPSWAQEDYEQLQQAGCNPKIIEARGNHGKPILAIEADCPCCGGAADLVAWPWSIGMMFRRCRGGCTVTAVTQALEQRLRRRPQLRQTG